MIGKAVAQVGLAFAGADRLAIKINAVMARTNRVLMVASCSDRSVQSRNEIEVDFTNFQT
jgi:hypothetical protein